MTIDDDRWPPNVGDAFLLRVSLNDIEPEIWRRFVAPVALSLSELHEVLQIVMGWTNSHMHGFEANDLRFEPPHSDNLVTAIDERAVTLGAVTRVGASFTYRYDFGDDWEHEVRVERILRRSTVGIVCEGGERACPPEDSGGAAGYPELCEALRDPKHPSHKELKRSVGRTFDPERFDLSAIQKKLTPLGKRFARSLRVVR